MLKSKNKKFDSVKQALSKVNRSIYRENLAFDSIAMLEKSAITGRVLLPSEPHPRKKSKNQAGFLEKYLKSQHKNSEGIQIFNLPKLPFGYHDPYNDSSEFISKHFKKDDAQDVMSKNLEMLTRKFRLFHKNNAKRSKSTCSKSKKTESASLYYFKMDSGFLICPKVDEINKIYDRDRESYHRRFVSTPDVTGRRSPEQIKDSVEMAKVQRDTVTRLCPSREKVETPLSKMFETKYEPLFSDAGESTRPVTSFNRRHWKSHM